MDYWVSCGPATANEKKRQMLTICFKFWLVSNNDFLSDSNQQYF